MQFDILVPDYILDPVGSTPHLSRDPRYENLQDDKSDLRVRRFENTFIAAAHHSSTSTIVTANYDVVEQGFTSTSSVTG